MLPGTKWLNKITGEEFTISARVIEFKDQFDISFLLDEKEFKNEFEQVLDPKIETPFWDTLSKIEGLHPKFREMAKRRHEDGISNKS